MEFPTFVEKPKEGLVVEGAHTADHEAASMMYNGNLLALLISREYEFEEGIP